MDEFLGTFTPRLDDKGRLFLPARFRAALAGGLVVTTGQEGCLYVFPTAEFHRISALMQAAPGSSRGGARLRARLPGQRPPRHPRQAGPGHRARPPLRAYAQLDKECTVIGNGNKLEVWDSAAWDAYLAEVMPAYSSYSVRLAGGGPGPLTPRSTTSRPRPHRRPTDDPTAGLQPTRLPTRLPPRRARIGWGPAAGSAHSRTPARTRTTTPHRPTRPTGGPR